MQIQFSNWTKKRKCLNENFNFINKKIQIINDLLKYEIHIMRHGTNNIILFNELGELYFYNRQ